VTGVTFVVPVFNAGDRLCDTLRSIRAQDADLPAQIVVVDDGSTDEGISRALRHLRGLSIEVVQGPGKGAAAALNTALAVARFPFVAQVDQDVVLERQWLRLLLARFDNPRVAAVQGQYVADPQSPVIARVMARDLEQRYSSLESETDHVCTGNVVYRTASLREVGGFDEALGYGYDNDMSYRLAEAGYRLKYCAEAISTHRWRPGCVGYLRQQYGFGYGRLDLVAKHRGRIRGDAVSPLTMMMHPIVAAIGCVALTLATISPTPLASMLMAFALGLFSLLAIERLAAGIQASYRFRDWVPLLFPLAHLGRDLAWVTAMAVWIARRAAGTSGRPHHSMRRTPVPYAFEPAAPVRPRR
jgi:cellulose synthase/poly-beta-1,6-N-acetylglucosamine synthase-like glycosyltransferase